MAPAARPVPEPGARPAARRARRPAPSAAQRRLWFLDQLGPGAAAYTVPLAYRLAGALDRGALARALAAVVTRHEALRTRLPAWEGEPYQHVDPHGPDLAVADLAGDPDPAARAAREAADEAGRPFDLAAGPLFRPRLLCLGPREHVLLMTVHHCVFDGMSLGILLGELSALYAAELRGGDAGLPALPFQYADAAARQHENRSAEHAAETSRYWHTRLAGLAPVLEMPTGRPRPRVPSGRAGEVPFALPAPVTAALAALGRDRSASMFMVALAGYLAVLAVHTGAEDIAVGIPVAAREQPGQELLIGFFANTLAIRVSLAGGPSFAQLVERTRDAVFDALAHQELPFDRLVEDLAPVRTLEHNPVVQVLFTMLHPETGGTADALRLPGVRAAEFAAGRPTTRFDLEMHVQEQDGALTGRLLYAEDVFDPDLPRWFAAHYTLLLAAAAAEPARALRDLRLLTDEEAGLIAAWNDAAAVP